MSPHNSGRTSAILAAPLLCLALAQAGQPSDERDAAGLRFRVSDAPRPATPSPGSPTRPSPTNAEALSDAEAAALLKRLPPLPERPSIPGFVLREKSLPPPSSGRVVRTAFPPENDRQRPQTPAPSALRVLRRSPEAEVSLAPNVTITFSQPMVPLTTTEDLAATSVPVRLSPQPRGRWRWLGTQTLLFEADERLPMATDYSVEVAAGARSASGGVLAARESWSFRTPPPKLVTSYPGSSTESSGVRPEVPLIAVFDQRVDPTAVLASLRVRARNVEQTVRLATSDEVAGDPKAKQVWARAPEGHAVAFRTSTPLPHDSEVRITIGAGTPSAEGPKRTTEPQTFSFRTFGPLRVVKRSCRQASAGCVPGAAWEIEFSNSLDISRFRKEMLRVDPPAMNGQWHASESSLSFYGEARGRTSYRVTLSPDLTDVHGQTLGREQTVVFDVGAAQPRLWVDAESLVVLDPAAPRPRFTFHSLELEAVDVAVYAVEPTHWPAFSSAVQFPYATRANPPGRLLRTERRRIPGPRESVAATTIDLMPFLANGRGHVIVVLDPVAERLSFGLRRIMHWVQATGIGLSAFADHARMLVWATSLRDGRPLSGVSVQPLGDRPAARTDAGGVAELATHDSSAVVARSGDDLAILPASVWAREAHWTAGERTDQLIWYVFDDRQLYRPGEEIKIKGWIRVATAGPRGDLAAAAGVGSSIRYTLVDRQDNELIKGDAPLDSAFGAFDISLTLPAQPNLGSATLKLDVEAPGKTGTTHTHWLQIQEFRRPEFEVKAEAGTGPHFVGGHVEVAAKASYYAGGGLAGAPVTWRVTSTSASFTPPNREGFSFGAWTPWWAPAFSGNWRSQQHQARTSADGAHAVRIDFDSLEPAFPASVRASASIEDLNRQQWDASVELLVHPGALYVGMRSLRSFVDTGQPLELGTLVTDLDGRAVGNRGVDLLAERIEWVQRGDEWVEQAADASRASLTSSDRPVRSTLSVRDAGVYRITATVKDSEGRPNQSQIRVWVTGVGRSQRATASADQVTLVPNKKEYRDGEAAEILVLAPFAPAEALLTLRRSGIVRVERFRMTSSSHSLRLPIDGSWTPNVHVQVDIVGAAERDARAPGTKPLPPRPAFASGGIELSIPPYDRALAVAVAPRAAELQPGAETALDVQVRDAHGRAAPNVEVAITVVDEAVLGLTGYSIPDPLLVFYSHREAGTSDHHLRRQLVLATPKELRQTEAYSQLGTVGETVHVEAAPAPPARQMAMMMSAAMSANRSETSGIALRTNFAALVAFVAAARTDAAGRVAVPIRLPDNLTRYRITALAATAEGRQFGKAEATLTTRLPLMVRPSPPRFLNHGDRAEIPVVLQNQTDETLEAAVGARSDALRLTGATAFRVSVPARGRAEVRFPVSAERPGPARLQVAAAAASLNDAAESSLPVWTPGSAETVAAYGQIDDGSAIQLVSVPRDVVPEFGGLDVTTSATALQSLTDAVLYLVRYPFECAEQISSRVLAIAALRDVLSAFSAEGLPSAEELSAAVARDIARLSEVQNTDGGFGFWLRGEDSDPFLSVHVTHALARARQKGYPVPEEVLDSAREYLSDIDDHTPDEWSDGVRRGIGAYAISVRHGLGDSDPEAALELIERATPQGLPLEALGWLLPVLHADARGTAATEAILRHLANRVSETANAARFATAYEDEGHLLLHSHRRSDAVVLEALIRIRPRHELIPKLVDGLLGARRKGRWASTQENAFVLLALERYFQTFEDKTPDFTARLWLGEAYAGEQSFRGRTMDRQQLRVPMPALIERTPASLLLAKEGSGRLYYRVGMSYAPAAEARLPPAAHGFTLERRYEGVEDASDVRRDADGRWRIRAGARVRVRLTLLTPAARHHVALVDALPAGLEPLNPELLRTRVEEDGGDTSHSPWWRYWFDHQNLRDERVEAFARLLAEGTYQYSYLARATTAGQFVVPAAHAEEMYSPETFGRGRADVVIIE